MKYIYLFLLLLTNFFGFSQTELIDYKALSGEKSKITIPRKYTFSRLYDYKINSKKLDSIVTKPFNENIPESVITTKYENQLLENKPDSISFSLRLVSKLSVDINKIRHVFIKYQEVNEKELDKIIVVNRVQNNWLELINKNIEVSLFESTIKNSSVCLLYTSDAADD